MWSMSWIGLSCPKRRPSWGPCWTCSSDRKRTRPAYGQGGIERGPRLPSVQTQIRGDLPPTTHRPNHREATEIPHRGRTRSRAEPVATAPQHTTGLRSWAEPGAIVHTPHQTRAYGVGQSQEPLHIVLSPKRKVDNSPCLHQEQVEAKPAFYFC